MWHGASVRTGLQIAREGFQLAFAGSGAGTMYGKACFVQKPHGAQALYFSESATKAGDRALPRIRMIPYNYIYLISAQGPSISLSG